MADTGCVVHAGDEWVRERLTMDGQEVPGFWQETMAKYQYWPMIGIPSLLEKKRRMRTGS